MTVVEQALNFATLYGKTIENDEIYILASKSEVRANCQLPLLVVVKFGLFFQHEMIIKIKASKDELVPNLKKEIEKV